VQVCKDIYFIRHAEGIHNRDEAAFPDFHTSGRSSSAEYHDAALTSVGREQARQLQLDLQVQNPDLVVSSPLSR
jgi:broad specificity phosphatase PhoE